MAGLPQSRLFLLLLLLLLWLPIAPSAAKSDSVFSLFNLRDKSRFWSESLIRGSNLESATSKAGLLNYTNSGNIASYLNLLEVDSLYLPIPVNFIFIGFEGKGNLDFKLNPEEVERWFTKIDHVFEHARVPKIGQILNPFYKSSVEKEQGHHFPVVSHVNYNFSVHAILTGEKVTSIFERALNVFARDDDVSVDKDKEDAILQVDVDDMEVLFSSFVEHLRLGDAYNIFIINPKRDLKGPKYGYRRGLSESEIEFLKQNKTLQAVIRQSKSTPRTRLVLEGVNKSLFDKHPGIDFSFKITEDSDTEEWYQMCINALNNIEKSIRENSTDTIIQSKVVQILEGKSEDMKLLLEKELKKGDFSNIQAECLTDTWIGKDRWAFIDLSAGPFTWGPAVGGEGVRTELSVPSVEKTIGAIAEISEAEAETHLQDAIQEKFSVFGDKDHQAIDILLAEIDIYELFSFKHCKGRKAKLALCEELDERMGDLKNELQSFEGEEYDETHQRKAKEALMRMEKWNLFSDTQVEHQNYTVARDTFLAHLGATLWGSMRHVISPSVAEGAFHYYEKISFQLFLVTQEKSRRLDQLPVDLKALKSGLSSLMQDSQKFSFTPHMLALSEDPALAMAFSVARRAAAVPLLLVNGTYRKNVHTYLDSSILQYQLQRLNDHGSLKGKHAHSRSTLEIPIFWFMHGEPLFVDKHYQAKALSDMIIVVQSEASSWESHLQCNGKPLLWDLRRPVKAALAAAAEHMAGVLPLHLVYSLAHDTAIEEWMWSVGCNPFSATSQGWRLSKFQGDTISRSYIVTALEESILTVNSAIHLLLMERTSEKTFRLFQSQEREILNKYNYVVSLWRRVSSVTGELRYGDAARLQNTLEDASRGFYELVNATIAILHPIHCSRERKVQVVFDATTIPAFVIVAGILYVLLRPRRSKPKIN